MQLYKMIKLEKYLSVFRFSFTHTLRNYKALIGLSIFLITCLIIFAHLWKVVAAKIETISLESGQLLWYIAFNEWVLLSLPDVQEEIEEDLHSGRFAYLLPRPISYLLNIFTEGLGALCARLLVLGLVAFIFTWIRTKGIPFSWETFLIALAIGFLSGCLAIILKMLIGVSAFWVRRVEPFHWIWEKLLFTLGGLMLPLAAYPEFLQKIALLTPFPAILGGRSALAIDFSWSQAFYIISILSLWGIIGSLSLIFLYRKGLRIVSIEGG